MRYLSTFALLFFLIGHARAADDVNLLRRGAILSGSSFQGTVNGSTVTVETDNYFTAVADENPATAWTPMEARGPHWLEMRWRYPVKITAFRWNGKNFSAARLQYGKSGRYEELVALHGAAGESTFPLVTTDRLRLQITEFTGKPVIYELAANGPSQPTAPARFPAEVAAEEKISVANVRLNKSDFKPGETIRVTFDLSSTAALKRDCYFIVEMREKSPNDYFREQFGDFFIAGAVIEAPAPASQWPPTQPQKLTAEIALPYYAPDGSTALSIMAITGDNKLRVPVENPRFGDNRLASLTIHRDDRKTAVTEYPAAKLADVNGQRGFQIGSRFEMPFFNRYMATSDFERFADSRADGIDIQYFLMYSSCIRPRAEWPEFLARLDQQITSTLRVRPESYFMIGMDLRTTKEWLRANPHELMLDRNGQVIKDKAAKEGLVSFGSPKYLRDCLDFLNATMAFLESKPYGGRVVGYHPWAITKLDAFIGGIENNSLQADRSKILIGDFHPGAIQLFRDWLRKKYHGSRDELRRAWRDDDVTFETAQPDALNLAAEDMPSGVFRDPAKSRAAIDYIEFFPTLIGGFHQKLAAHIKERTQRKALVMLHYGAILHNLALLQPSGARSHANNFDLYNLLRDGNIDMYVQSMPYNLRHSGDPVVFYQPIESLNVNGRMYFADYDARTIASGTLRYGRHRSQYETKAVIQRDLAWLMLKNSGAWLSDMSKASWREWIEYRKPWFSPPEVTAPTREVLQLFDKATAIPKKSASEIAVVLDIQTPPYEDTLNAGVIYRGLSNRFMREEMVKLGAPYDILLTRDLQNPRVRQNYKLYIFINPFYLDKAARDSINKLKRDGKTLLWFYAPGYVSDNGFNVQVVSQLTGFNTQIKDKAELLQMKTGAADSALLAKLGGVTYKNDMFTSITHIHPKVVQPVFYVDDPQAQTLATYPDGKTAWAARDFGSWKSIYSAVPLLDVQAIRNIARYAGVHLYCDEDIVMGADNRFLMFNNGYDGKRTITVNLPEIKTVKDAFTGAIISQGKKSFPLTLDTPDTRILSLE
jgi:hypothetical protein